MKRRPSLKTFTRVPRHDGTRHPDIPRLVYVSLSDRECAASISGYVTPAQRALLIKTFVKKTRAVVDDLVL